MADLPPKRIPLAVPTANRDNSTDKDARIINGYTERDQSGEIQVYKRPGYLVYAAIAAGTGRGIFYWQGSIYSVFAGSLYKDGINKGAVDATAGSFYTFSSCLGSTPKLFLQNGVEGYYYDDGGGLVNVVDADYPATTVPGVVYLDGTLYVMTPGGYINGCDIEDPSSWDPLNSILAQIEPDPGVALHKQMSYVVAFKGWSTEVFYDATNATGSPLGRVEGAKVSVGSRHARSCQDLDGTLIWISTSRTGSCSVHSMTGVKASDISTPAVTRLLQGSDYTTVYSWSMSFNGHKFYVVTLVVSNLTLAYDLKEQQWFRWTDTDGNYIPIVASASNSSTSIILQHESNGNLYVVTENTFSDDGDVFTFEIFTPIFDGGTRVGKTVHMLEVIADQANSGNVEISFSDDDYQTFSDPREIDLLESRVREPDWGTFTRRAHHIKNRDNRPLRIKAIELTMELGSL